MPLRVLHDAPGAAADPVPPALTELYGSGIGFSPPVLYTNFVTSLDGAATLGDATSSAAIADGSEADRFVMGLLRAFAGAVLIGAGTLRAEPRHRWTPAYVFPDQAPAFAALRAGLGLPESPRLAVVTASGGVDPSIAALEGALILTSPDAAPGLRAAMPASAEVVAIDAAGQGAPAAIVGALRDAGHSRILCEGGPHLLGSLIAAGLVDEVFLTLSPVLAGEHEGGLAMVAGVGFHPPAWPRAELLSARIHGSHLFLRYALDGPGPAR